jgi:hypothetical protein
MSRRYLGAAALCLLLTVLATACVGSGGWQAKGRGATLEVVSQTSTYRRVGTAFALKEGHIATAAHTIDDFIGGRFGLPVAKASNGSTYAFARVVAYSQSRDFAVLTLDASADLTPVEVRTSELAPGEALMFAGRQTQGGIVFGKGTYVGTTIDATTKAPSIDFAAEGRHALTERALSRFEPTNVAAPRMDSQRSGLRCRITRPRSAGWPRSAHASRAHCVRVLCDPATPVRGELRERMHHRTVVQLTRNWPGGPAPTLSIPVGPPG